MIERISKFDVGTIYPGNKEMCRRIDMLAWYGSVCIMERNVCLKINQADSVSEKGRVHSQGIEIVIKIIGLFIILYLSIFLSYQK